MAEDVVRIHGLRELRASLRRMDRNLPKGIRKAGNKAAKLVVDKARPRVPVVTGRAARSIRAASTQRAVRVAEGGARAPYMPWLDFGGTINKHTAHPTHRPFRKHGRFIWAVFAEHRREVVDTYTAEVRRVGRDAGVRFGGIL